MQKLTKAFSIGTTIWLIIFFIDYLYNLFQIDTTSVITTMTGLRISTVITETELNTTFSLTLQVVLIYFLFIGLWVILWFILLKINKSKKVN